MATYIALLRAINVGTGRKVPMADLREVFAAAGATDVVTYIQSGNVVFDHPGRSLPKLRAALEPAISEAFGFDIPVILRTRAQLRAVIEHCPYDPEHPSHLSVVFFNGAAPQPPAKLDLASFAPEELTVQGDQVYLHLPNGMGRSKLPAALGKSTAAGTARNWNTVNKLVALADR